MSQKPDNLRTVLRLSKPLRERVKREAQKNRCTLNMEMARRIEESFHTGAIRSIEDLADDLAKRYRKLVDA